MSNEDILSKVRNVVKSNVPKYSFNLDENRPKELRCPNEKEQRFWMKEILQGIYFFGDTSMGYNTYKTLRGHIRRSQFDVVFKCLRNKRYCTEKHVDYLISSFEKYCNSKTIEVYKMNITFPNPVERVSIDICVTSER